MIGIEELKQRFPDVRDIKPYGFVVVVPGKEFDPDWEFQLEDKGYKVHLVELDRRPVALVSCVKKEAVEESEREVYAPPPPDPESRKHLMPMAPTAHITHTAHIAHIAPTVAPSIGGRGSYLKAGNKLVPWRQDDVDRLKEEWPKTRGGVDEKAEALTKLFPGRTATAIKLRYLKLLKTPKTTKEERQKPQIVKHGRGFNWSEGETQKLIALWNQDMQVSDIAAALPKRSYKSVRSAVDRLQLAGKIEKRKTERRRQRKSVEQQRSENVAVKEVQNSDKVANVDNVDNVDNVTKVEKVSMDSQTSPTAPSELKRLTEVLDALIIVVDKVGCQAIMQALEIKEMKQSDFKIPLGTWTAYASALISPDKERRDQFREKVRKLLEVYE